MTNSGKVTVEISPESADALALVSSLKTDWDVAPTMIRGSKKTPGQLGRPPPDPKKKKYGSISTQGLPGARKRKRADDDEAEFAEMSAENMTDKDYRKTPKGRHAIKLKMQQLFDIDVEMFPLARTFDPQTLKCRLKDEGAQLLMWDQFLNAAPDYMIAMFLAADGNGVKLFLFFHYMFPGFVPTPSLHRFFSSFPFRYIHVVSVEGWGKAVHRMFSTIESQFRESPPRRVAWVRCLKEISDYVNASQSRAATESGK